MLNWLLVPLLLTGTFDAGGQLGGNVPFGSLEFNHRGGITGAVTVGYNSARSRIEVGQEFAQLPGLQQPDYSLNVMRTSLSYHYLFSRHVDWGLRAGAGLDWTNLQRMLYSSRETGSVLGGTLALTYVRSFGHPQFTFQLYGSELLEFGHAGSDRTLVPATLLGLKIGAGYEF